MDGLSRASTDTRARGQRRVLAVTAATGLAAAGITGALTLALGATGAVATTTATTTTTTTTGTDSGTAAVTTTGSAPVASSGGS